MGSKNAGANKADAANKQVQKQQNAIQAKEAKKFVPLLLVEV